MLAYPGLFLVMASDAVRYSVGWFGWGLLVTIGIIASVGFLMAFDSRATLSRIPTVLYALLGLMATSVLWSSYQAQTMLAVSLQLGSTVFALFLANQFGWRQLLNILANTVRFILFASLLFELIAAVAGPIAPLFPNYQGEPPTASYLWSQGNLFEGQRIQGILGNANLLAFVAVLGIWLFLVELIVTAELRTIPILSLGLAVAMALLAKSAGMTVAMALITFAAVVAILAEGKSVAGRLVIYRRAGLLLLATAATAIWSYREIFDFLGKSADASGRFYIWGEVWSLISQKSVFGWGWISYWIPGVEPWEGLAVINRVPMYQAHNAYLDVWAQLGLIGLAIFAWLVIQAFVRSWHVAVRHTSPLYLYPLFVLLVILGQSLTESRLLIEIGWVLLILVLVKSREGFAELEPMGSSTKLTKLSRAARKVAKVLRKPGPGFAKPTR